MSIACPCPRCQWSNVTIPGGNILGACAAVVPSRPHRWFANAGGILCPILPGPAQMAHSASLAPSLALTILECFKSTLDRQCSAEGEMPFVSLCSLSTVKSFTKKSDMSMLSATTLLCLLSPVPFLLKGGEWVNLSSGPKIILILSCYCQQSKRKVASSPVGL